MTERTATDKKRTCMVCGKRMGGRKPLGGTDIWLGKRKIGRSYYYEGKMGYAHLRCIKAGKEAK